MRSLCTLLAVVLLSGCGRPHQSPSKVGGLTADQYQLMTNLNAQQEDNRAVVHEALGLGANSPAGRDPATRQKMLREVQRSNCIRNHQPKDGGGTELVQLDGQGCPIDFLKRWTVNSSERTLTLGYQAKSVEYRRLNPIRSRYGGGSLSLTQQGSEQRVRGKITFNNFRVEGLGPLFAELVISHSRWGEREQGQMVIVVQRYGGFRINGTMRWSSSGASTYTVNGVPCDERSFADLFSSFDADEIVAIARQMR